MTQLKFLEGENIRLVDVDNEVFEGEVGDYIYPEDNEPEGEEGIILDDPAYEYPIQFNKKEIKSITII